MPRGREPRCTDGLVIGSLISAGAVLEDTGASWIPAQCLLLGPRSFGREQAVDVSNQRSDRFGRDQPRLLSEEAPVANEGDLPRARHGRGGDRRACCPRLIRTGNERGSAHQRKQQDDEESMQFTHRRPIAATTEHGQHLVHSISHSSPSPQKNPPQTHLRP